MKLNELPTIQSEMLFEALLYVLKKENIEYEKKYDELREQIIRHDVTDLLDLLEPFYQTIKNDSNNEEYEQEEVMSDEKYMITIKDNSFAEIGHCFRCETKGEKIIVHNDVSCRSVTIPIEQFQHVFKEMSIEDYETYIEACFNGEDPIFEAIVKKYLNLYLD